MRPSLHESVTLVIGDLERWKAQGRSLPDLPGFRFADVSELTADFVLSIGADIVLSPLLAREFDAVEIARRLNDMGFAGRYRVVSQELPDPDLIRAEVGEVAPGLDFGLLTLPALAGLGVSVT